MKLAEHYNSLYQTAVEAIKFDQYQLDNLIDSELDDRRGVTLLIRPPKEVVGNIQRFLAKLYSIEPDQYYYPAADIHVTVLTIISCYSGFNVANINIADYVAVLKKSLERQGHLEIEFKGVTASPSCILIQGFVGNDLLNDMRERIRNEFSQSELQQSIDKRYAIQTAHSTVVRFRDKLTNKQKFIDELERHREYSFGKCEVSNFELVGNDWYHLSRNEMVLHNFELK